MKKDLILNSGEYTYYKYAKEVGRVIDGNYTGHGNDGKIVRFDKNNVIKLWYDSDFECELNPATKEEYINNLKNMIDDNCNFKYIYTPKRFVIYKNEIVGYVMKYFYGRNIKDISELTSFRALLSGLKRFEKEIYEFSKLGYKLDDIHDKNLMLNQKHKILSFGLMDPDSYEKLSSFDFIDLYESNISEIRKIVLNAFLNDELEKFILKSKSLNHVYQLILQDKNDELYTFLEELKLRVEKYSKSKINTIGDFKTLLKR
jgi:hypothetical protein